MEQSHRGSFRVAVVGAGDSGHDQLRDTVEGDGVETERFADVGAALSGVGDGPVDCLVVVDPADYERVRDEMSTVPVLVATADVDRETLARVVEDAYADHVDPTGTVEGACSVRLRRLLERDPSAVAWELADFADGAVVEFDLETRRLVDANDVFFEAWGWDRDRFDGAVLADVYVTDISAELRGQGRGAAGEEELEWISDADPEESLVAGATRGHYETREWHCRDADGDGFKSEVRVVADEATRRGFLVATTPEDGPHGGSESARDATVARGRGADRDRGSDREETSMLRSLLEHIPMSVYFKDARGRHVLVSEDVVEPFIESPEGKILHTPGDVLGKTDFDLYPADGAAEAVTEDDRIMDSGEPLVDKVEEVHPPHGRPLYFKTTKAPWYDDDGRVRGIVGVTTDITDEKRRERELDRQNERLDQFAGIVSHDLRNPLNVARGRLQVYRTRGGEENLDDVSEMHERMEQLIRDVLTFAREGSRVEDIEWFDGRRVATQAWSTVDTARATLEQEWDYRIGGDPDRLARVFENLFRNAVEHGGSDVTVEVGTLDEENGFYVHDDGSGVPADERDQVFEHGFSTDEDGTGYGLAIVREIAEAHGWTVELLESERGARFEFTGVPRGDAL
jgi:PAS domain S-box-containing protein